MMRLRAAILVLTFAAPAFAQQGGAAPVALTIYNQDFAVARTTVDLNLSAGTNQVTTTNVTSQLEPDSVVLRDPAGKVAFKVDEQNYDAGVVDQNSLLMKYEGKTIQFAQNYNGTGPFVTAKIIRAGQQPIVEVNNVIQFTYPGQPQFPDTTDGLLLKPTLKWEISAPKAAHLAAELGYITHGMSWQATYNVVAPETKDVTGPEKVDLGGWVTIQNKTGTDFPKARIKLMAGDVAKLRDMSGRARYMLSDDTTAFALGALSNEVVTQQAFDDFHLYDLNRTVSLADKETKQVDFLEATGVTMNRSYQYDGTTERNLMFPCSGCNNTQPNFNTGSNTKVTARAEIRNATANHLGMPLPAGRIRLYRRDSSGQMEFIGEGTITHTPTDETVKVPVGAAFDVTGSRRQTDFHVDQRGRTIDETFEVIVKNQKASPVSVDVVEHMNRAMNWQLTEKSTDFVKRDSATVSFPIAVPAAGEVKVTYSVRYTW